MLARVKVIAAYPITPQTTIVEELSKFCADGRLDADFVKVESEHSAMACCIGATATGVRTFTATSSHGLLYMHEGLHWAAGARLPIVMANVNRSVGAPWSIRCDQNDSLSQRDTGWIQLYCEDNQEVMDTIVQAYKVAERVSLPCMILLEGFSLSHTTDIVEILDQELVDRYLADSQPENRLDLEDPHSFCGTCSPVPNAYFNFRYHQQKAMEEAKAVFKAADEEFHQVFGRRYGPLETYRCEEAEVVLVTSGTITSTARDTVDDLRKSGQRIGLIKIKMFRPFPSDEIAALLAPYEKVAVIDRNLSSGQGGIFAAEIKAALYNRKKRPALFGFVAGLGGMDVTPSLIEDMIRFTLENESPPADILWAA
ncbi:MAG: pyruvate ferredoxin oxidoreductase [Deltaproteobacteria bacterium]|nr:pyruvate ferredoxin oxidoreductase [Deltaproteobacteria bacterium]